MHEARSVTVEDLPLLRERAALVVDLDGREIGPVADLHHPHGAGLDAAWALVTIEDHNGDQDWRYVPLRDAELAAGPHDGPLCVQWSREQVEAAPTGTGIDPGLSPPLQVQLEHHFGLASSDTSPGAATSDEHYRGQPFPSESAPDTGA